MTWYDVDIAIDGDDFRRYAVEAPNEGQARLYALAQLPTPDVNYCVPLAVAPDEFEPMFDAVIPMEEVPTIETPLPDVR